MYKLSWRKYVNGELSKACQIAAFPIYKWTKTMKFLRTKLVSSFKSRHSQSKAQSRRKSSERIVLIGKINTGISQLPHKRYQKLESHCNFCWNLVKCKKALWKHQYLQYWSQRLVSNNTQAQRSSADWSQEENIRFCIIVSPLSLNVPQFRVEKDLIAPFPPFPLLTIKNY